MFSTPGKAPGTMCLRHEYLFTLNVFNLLLSSNPLRLCPFTHVTTGVLMSNADDFQDKPVRAGRLSSSPTTQTSVFPYTSLFGDFSQDVYGRTSVPACHHNIRRGRLTYHALVIWITLFPFATYVHPVRYILNLSARRILTNNLTG